MKNQFVTDRSKSYAKKNEQFAACRRENMPLVSIRPRREFAFVEVDMFTTNRNLDETAIHQIAALLAEHTEEKHIAVSAVSCSADRVPKSSAELLAARLYDIAVAAMPRLSSIGSNAGRRI